LQESALLQGLLHSGAVCVNTSDASRVTALFEASYYGNQSLVELLITNGADVNLPDADGNSPLFIASQEGHVGCVEALLPHANLEQREQHGATPLFVAAAQGEDGVLARLLHANADPNASRSRDGASPLQVACGSGFAGCAALLCGAGAMKPWSAFRAAIRANSAQCVEVLLTTGAPYQTPLDEHTLRDHLSVAKATTDDAPILALLTRAYLEAKVNRVVKEVVYELIGRLEVASPGEVAESEPCSEQGEEDGGDGGPVQQPDEGAAASASTAIAVGARVRIHSIQSRPELNDCLGTVASHNTATGRVNVTLDGSGETLALRPLALGSIEGAEAAAEEEEAVVTSPRKRRLVVEDEDGEDEDAEDETASQVVLEQREGRTVAAEGGASVVAATEQASASEATRECARQRERRPKKARRKGRSTSHALLALGRLMPKAWRR